MRGLRGSLVAVLLIGAVAMVPTESASGADKVTFTVGQLQNVDS